MKVDSMLGQHQMMIGQFSSSRVWITDTQSRSEIMGEYIIILSDTSVQIQ